MSNFFKVFIICLAVPVGSIWAQSKPVIGEKAVVCSLYGLLVNADFYDGKLVRCEGVMRVSADGRFCIYPNRDDYEFDRVCNSIDIQNDIQASDKSVRRSVVTNGKNVTIEGVFSSYGTYKNKEGDQILVLGGSPHGVIRLKAIVRTF